MTTNTPTPLYKRLDRLCDLFTCEEYLAKYPDPQVSKVISDMESRITELENAAFQSLIFPRIVNYLMTYSAPTVEQGIYSGYEILNVDSSAAMPNITYRWNSGYDNKSPSDSNIMKLTILATMYGTGMVTLKIESMNEDSDDQPRFERIVHLTKHTDLVAWLDANL